MTSSSFLNLSNSIRNLSIDMISRANSGHPGICLGIADILTVLYRDFLKFNPKDSNWKFRDRLVLSAGHGSASIYSSLFLSGYNLSLEDLKNFRQIHSKTPGHPELGITEGVEITTGPLGQGIANAVGMAISYKILSEKFEKLKEKNVILKNEENPFKKVKIYCIVGDGCLMEGISQEAISFAAKYNLTNLVVIFDNNNITIDGRTGLSTIENHNKRFEVLGFETIEIDGHNEDEIKLALKKANEKEKMLFISAKTKIGYKSLKEDSEKAHGSPFSKEEVSHYKKITNWKEEPFYLPEEALSDWRNFYKRNLENFNKTKLCEENLRNFMKNYKENKENLEEMEDLTLFESFFNEEFLKENLTNLEKSLQNFKEEALKNRGKVSTRKFSQKVLDFFLNYKNFLFGSADLTESVCMNFKKIFPINEKSYTGNFIHYGIREHAMAAIMNGIATCGFMPLGGTFLCFSDYMRPAIRLSALMNLKVLYIFTHDSIFLGEDGPTHQAIEHFSSLNLIPNLNVFRPCNEIEVIECYQVILNDFKEKSKPSVIILTRQDIDVFSLENSDYNLLENRSQKGAYEIFNIKSKNETGQKIILIANGSEVSLVAKAVEFSIKNQGELKNFDIKIVSMPSVNLFSLQEKSYKEELLEFNNKNAKRIAIFAGNGEIFRKFLNYDDHLIDIQRFGESANYQDLLSYFKFDEKGLEQKILEYIKIF